LVAGTYTVTITDSEGCTKQQSATITEPPALTSSEQHTNVSCFGGNNGSIDITPSGGTPGYTYLWNDGVTTTQDRTGLAAGTYTVTITDAEGCTTQKSATITQPAVLSCSITQPQAPPSCGSEGNTLSASAVGGTGAYTIVWSIDAAGTLAGWAITGGQGTTSITYTAGAGGSAQFTMQVTDANGCVTSCSITLSCTPPQMEYCGLTQGFYGNERGKFGCDPAITNRCVPMIAERIVELMLTNYGNLTVGKPGRSFTLRQANALADAKCLVKKLPTGTTPATLPAGDATFNGGCSTTPVSYPTWQKGRWQNVLLGQTITLSLNVRYDGFLHGGPPHGLGGLELCASMTTMGSLPGPDGKPGSGDEVINLNSTPKQFTISNKVLCALALVGDGTPTVNNLLELANLALGGQPLPLGLTLAEVNAAVSAINDGFDECRFLVSCTGGCVSNGPVAEPMMKTTDLAPEQEIVNGAPSPTGFAFWSKVINSCNGDRACLEKKEAEIRESSMARAVSGEDIAWVRQLYHAAYGKVFDTAASINLNEFLPDTRAIGEGVFKNEEGSEHMLESNKQTFVAQFVQRERFISEYPTALTPAEFVGKLLKNSGLTLTGSDRAAVIKEFGESRNTGDFTIRARVLRRIAEKAAPK
jgi:hypothetical protein